MCRGGDCPPRPPLQYGSNKRSSRNKLNTNEFQPDVKKENFHPSQLVWTHQTIEITMHACPFSAPWPGGRTLVNRRRDEKIQLPHCQPHACARNRSAHASVERLMVKTNITHTSVTDKWCSHAHCFWTRSISHPVSAHRGQELQRWSTQRARNPRSTKVNNNK